MLDELKQEEIKSVTVIISCQFQLSKSTKLLKVISPPYFFSFQLWSGCHAELPDQEKPQPGGRVPRRNNLRGRGLARRAREDRRGDQEV